MRTLFWIFLIGSFFGIWAQEEKTSEDTTSSEELQEPIEKTTMVSESLSSNENEQEMTIKACILLALKNNLDIKIERFNPRIADEGTLSSVAAFDPTLFSKLTYGRSRESTSSFFDPSAAESSVDSKTTDWSFGIKDKFITGTQAELQYRVTRSESGDQLSITSLFAGTSTANPRYNTTLSLKLTQPLLKNFGIEYNTSNIQISRNNKAIADLQLLDTARVQISNVLKIYWDLVLARSERSVNDQSLRRAERLLEVNKAKQKLGQASAVDVLQAEVGIATQLEDILIAENQVLNIESKLKRSILPASELSFKQNVRIKPQDQANFTPEPINLEQVLSTALKVRPDFLVLKKDIDNRSLTTNQKENQTWPTLDAIASYSINGGQESDWGDSLNTMSDWHNYQWEVGLVFEYPLGTRAARADLRKSKLEMQQSQLRLLNRETAIIVEVEEFTRNIKTTLQRIEAAKKARELAEKQLEAEEAKFKVGRTTNKNVLDFQEDLAQAQTRELRAVVAYKKALIDLKTSRGTLLEDYDIDFD